MKMVPNVDVFFGYVTVMAIFTGTKGKLVGTNEVVLMKVMPIVDVIGNVTGVATFAGTGSPTAGESAARYWRF